MRVKVKKSKVLCLIATLVMVLSMIYIPAIKTQAAGRWMQYYADWWYLNEDGTYPVNEWKEVEGKWYLFNSEGYVIYNSWKQAQTTADWYYVGNDGAMVTGWQLINGDWYYFDNDGVMAHDTKIGEYELDSDGVWMGGHTGWFKKHDQWYYYKADGTPFSGWLQSGPDWYYIDEGGKAHSGWLQYNGGWYYTDSDGKIRKDWVQVDGTWYLFDSTGKWIDDNKIIYLTFDDGPGPYTSRLLDILDKYNVKATFFVTGAYPGYANCIGRAYNAGHAIGVHSYTHNYNQIYASESAYWSDFEKVEDLIVSQTGQRTNIFRFPGGSSNAVSKFNPGIMTRLTKQAGQKGYYYFDWNVLSGDAGETTSSTGVYNNIVKGVSGRSTSVVLCHDIKGFTVDAMESFIPWAQSNGYTFLPLTENSPGAHHSLNN